MSSSYSHIYDIFNIEENVKKRHDKDNISI